MKNNFTWKIVLCLGLMVLAGVTVGLAAYQYATTGGGFKLGVDLVGGTTLVYEVDQDKFSDPQAKRDFEQRSSQLAVSLKHRIDPADLYNITVRPAGTWRVEIILPTGGAHQADLEARAWQNLLGQIQSHYALPADANLQDVPQGQKLPLVARVHDVLLAQGKDESPEAISKFVDEHFTQQRLTSEEVEKVKEKIAQVGSLEFRILANSHDDKAALDAATAYFEKAQKDPNSPERKALADAAITGRAPPPPRDADGNPMMPTETNIGSYTYSWVELGRTERQSLGLSNEVAGPTPYTEVEGTQVDQRRHFWHEVAVARGEERIEHAVENGRPVTRYVKAAGAAWDKLLQDVRQEYKLPADADLATGVPAGETDALAARVHDLLKEKKREEPVVAIRKFIHDHYKLETFQTVPLPQAGGALLYSRVVPNPSRLPVADRDKKYEYFLLTRDPEKGKEVTGLYLESSQRTQDSQMRPAIGFRFNQQGGDRFFDLTSLNAPTREGFHRFLAIVLDGQIVSAPSLNARISREGIIEGNFTADEVDRYVNILNSGALPASLKPVPVSENTIGATLGADTIFWGTVSVLIAFGVVLLFMLIYYRFAGLVACVALLANLLLTVAFMIVVSATFTLPGLAGLVLMLGMAVDANVLIYERLREERERGANLALSIRNGYDRAFSVIIDTHLSSIFTAIVLYAVGNDQLKGFGISLTVGLFISLFTSLFMTRVMFDLWYSRGWLKKLGMLRLFHRPNIDFMAIRYYFFTATIALTLIGAALFFARVYNKSGLNIDFVGGTAYTGQLTHPVSITDLRNMLSEGAQKAKLQVADVQEVGTNGMTYRIQYANAKEPATIDLPNAATPEEMKRRASQLPDMAVDQIFLTTDDPNVRQGGNSAIFTVRTAEKAPELVQLEITQLLGDNLKRIEIQPAPGDNPYAINSTNTQATLHFVSQKPGTEEMVPAYASPAQVHMLLDRTLRSMDLSAQAQQFVLEGVGKQEDGRFQEMKLTLTEPLDRAQLQKALATTASQFRDRPQPERLENFDSQLAEETQTRALYAILASWGAILLYLWFRFGNWTFGLAAVLCLVHDLFFTLGAIALAHYIHLYVPWLARILLLDDFKIDLPAVAALLTLVGYSVNDTIVVFDRIREVRGKNPDLTPKMINDSVNQTLSRTILTALTVFLVVIVLYVFGGEGVHLFSFVMVVGVFVGTYSSIYIASPLLLIFGEGRRAGAIRERVAAGAV